MRSPHLPSASTRAKIKNIAATFLCAAGVPTLARRQHRDRLAILMFHGVVPKPLSPPCWHVLDVALFRRELEYISEHFHVLPLEEALERLATGTLPPRAVAITFDDGTRNLATHAAPILREMDLPAAIFVTTGPMGTRNTLWPDRLWLAFARSDATEADLTPLGLGMQSLANAALRGTAYAAAVHRLKEFADEDRINLLEVLFRSLGSTDDDPGPFELLSWDEAREIAEDGRLTLYPHAVTHPILSQCSDEKVEYEIAGSHATVERETGKSPAIFAYPNGRLQDFDDRAKNALRRLGVRWALATTTGFADRDSDPLALPRLPIGGDTSFDFFRLLCSGLP